MRQYFIALTIDIASLSVIRYIFCGLFNVLEKNATGFQFWIGFAIIATVLTSVSSTKLWSSSMGIKVTSPRSFFGFSKVLISLVDIGNISVSFKGLISVEKSAIHFV